MRKWHYSPFLLVVILIAVPFFSPSATTSTCVSCHTDDAKMKSLVKPPEIHVEGEG